MSFSHAHCCFSVIRYLCVYVFVHIYFVDVGECCNNRAAFVFVSELVIVVAFAFIYC